MEKKLSQKPQHMQIKVTLANQFGSLFPHLFVDMIFFMEQGAYHHTKRSSKEKAEKKK